MNERERLQERDSRCRAMTAAIYVRKSTATEGRSRSRDEQLEICQRDAEYFGFGRVLTFIEDEGQKGDWFWRDREGRHPAPYRPELTRLVEAIERGEIDVVLCYRVDRLVRSAEVMVALRKLLVKYRVRLVCQGRDSELDTARGKYQNAVDSAVAEQWRDQISEDIRRDHSYKARNGMFSRNPSCLGFRSKGRGSQAVDPVPHELDLVNRIFRLYVHGEDPRGPLGISAIAKQLIDEGISLAVGAKGHRSRNPAKVRTGQIRTILANCMYVGRWRHKGEEYKCDRLLVDDPITGEKRTAVPIALYESAQDRLASMPVKGRKSVYSDHLLSGLLVCGSCGRPLHVNNKRRSDGSTRHTYLCSRRRDTIPCDRQGMANLIEEQVDEWVMQHLAPYMAGEVRAMRLVAEASAERNRLAEVERQLAAAKLRECDQLASLVGMLDVEQYGAVASRLRAEREGLERQVQELRRVVEKNSFPLPLAGDVDLTSLSRQAAKTALRQAIKWIAVTRRGLVVLTSWSAYIGAEIEPARNAVWNSPLPRRRIRPPDAAACVECLSWLPNRERFIAGRRQALGPAADGYRDDEILPPLHCGYIEVMSA